MKRFRTILLSIIALLSFITTSFGGDLGDGFYLHNVDQYTDIVSLTISPAKMSNLLNNEVDGMAEFAEISKSSCAKLGSDNKLDFIFFICFSNLSEIEINQYSYHIPVSKDATGIGEPLGLKDIWNLPSRLKGISLLCDVDSIFLGVLLHEMSHQWAAHIFRDEINSMITLTNPGHWGLSNAGGVLGGFKDVIKIGDNKYKGSVFPNNKEFSLTSNLNVPFSDIELYLMGLKSAQELRSTGFKLNIYTGGSVDTPYNYIPDGYFTATGIKSYTIDDIISRYGPRIPDVSTSQKHFKVTIVVLTDGSIPLNYSKIVSSLRWFAGDMNDKSNTQYPNAYNFAKATGGRGTIEIEGLREVSNPVKPEEPADRYDVKVKPTLDSTGTHLTLEFTFYVNGEKQNDAFAPILNDKAVFEQYASVNINIKTSESSEGRDFISDTQEYYADRVIADYTFDEALDLDVDYLFTYEGISDERNPMPDELMEEIERKYADWMEAQDRYVGVAVNGGQPVHIERADDTPPNDTPSKGSSGGGCNAVFGLFGLLPLAVWVARKRMAA
jgi:hypothetical protein